MFDFSRWYDCANDKEEAELQAFMYKIAAYGDYKSPFNSMWEELSETDWNYMLSFADADLSYELSRERHVVMAFVGALIAFMTTETYFPEYVDDVAKVYSSFWND